MVDSIRLSDELKKNYFSKDKIAALIISLINENKLNDYVGEFEFEGKTQNNHSSIYLANENKLTIYLGNINFNFDNWFLNSRIPLKDEYHIRYYNMNILKIIYHEIEHIKQNKDSQELKNNDSLNSLICEGMELYRRSPDNLSQKEKILYNIFRKCVLTERDAEIMSFVNTLKIFNDDLFLFNNLINHLLMGYNKKSPSAEYYALRGKKNEYQKISFRENYNNLIRLSWGMPIDNELIEELKEIKEKKDIKMLKKTLYK